MTRPFRAFIGWDQHEPTAYNVTNYSLEPRPLIPVSVTPIKLEEMRKRGMYQRARFRAPMRKRA